MSYRVALLAAAFGLLGSIAARAGDPPTPPGAVMRLGDTRFRAGGPVSDLLFSTDSEELISRVSVDTTTTRITVWDVATGRQIRTSTGPARPETRIRWGTTIIPDSTRGVVVGSDGVPVVRDFETGKDLARLTGHFARVTAVTVSPDGRWIATGSADGLIRVWDAETARPVDDQRGHSAAVCGLDVSPDGRLAATIGADGTVRVWDLGTGRERRAFPATGEGIATFTPDGAAIRIPSADRIIVRDLVTGLEIVPPSAQPADLLAGPAWMLRQAGVSIALAPDGRTIAVGHRSGEIAIYEVATGGLRRRLVESGAGCRDLIFTPNGARLLSAGADHAAMVWAIRLRDVPLPRVLKRETNAANLWERMTEGEADAAYLAMARLAADPVAAVKMARLRLASGFASSPIGDGRAVELIEAIGTSDARALLRELADDTTAGVRSREAGRALIRLGEPGSHRGDIRTTSGSRP